MNRCDKHKNKKVEEMELLKNLYRIYSGSNLETPMRVFIHGWIREHAPEAEMCVDLYGNLLVKKGKGETYPCLVAHMDQVQRPYPPGYKVLERGGVIMGVGGRYGVPCGLGADDKNGIWVALKMLERHECMKAVFFVGEEIGCVGSRGVDMSFFDDCRWVIQCDRRGGSDLIYHTNGVDVCSREFLDACNDGTWTPAIGSCTDVGALMKRGLKVCALNMSCGYHDAHTDVECTVVTELMKCLDNVDRIIRTVTRVMPFDHEDERYRHGLPEARWEWGSGRKRDKDWRVSWKDKGCAKVKEKGGANCEAELDEEIEDWMIEHDRFMPM